MDESRFRGNVSSAWNKGRDVRIGFQYRLSAPPLSWTWLGWVLVWMWMWMWMKYQSKILVGVGFGDGVGDAALQ